MIKRWFRRSDPARLRVLMVCMGNLCRSPMAEAVLRTKLQRAGLEAAVAVDSAGTHGFHKGTPAESTATTPANPARCNLARSTASAIGERQMLAVQTMSRRTRAESERQNQRANMAAG